jgi:hypothetical protein
MNSPEARPGDWITIGNRNVVVCQVYERTDDSIKVEVVYLDRDRAINEDAIWSNDKWNFALSGVVGGYADNYPRLSRFVSQLRAGRRF